MAQSHKRLPKAPSHKTSKERGKRNANNHKVINGKD